MSSPEIWNRQRVLELAPDAKSITAGEKQARSGKWDALGQNERALWGEVRGSGKRPYQIAIDLSEPAFKCSCPSRKFPCKHGLGLFLVFANDASRLVQDENPPWVQDWIVQRDQRQEKRELRVARQAAKEVDPEAQAKREAKRSAIMDAGIEELDLFLLDVARQGLAATRTRPTKDWDQMAARMVDAQMPGLARKVRELGSELHSGTGWESRFAQHLGLIHLSLVAWRRRDELPPSTRTDIRTYLGWALTIQDLEAKAEPGTWRVLGQYVFEDGHLLGQRTWLQRAVDQRFALILSFAAGGQPLDTSFIVGTEFESELTFYPSAMPLRAVCKIAPAETRVMQPTLLAPGSVAPALDGFARSVGAQPWLPLSPVEISGVQLHRPSRGDSNDRWLIVDQSGELLPIRIGDAEAWSLVAVTGGRPFVVFGEWDGRELRPLTALTEVGIYSIGRDSRKPLVVPVS